MRPETPISGYVDGAWWPRSRDLTAELSALIEALTARLPDIQRISFNLGEWDTPPPRLVLNSRRVRLSGFRSQPAHTVDLIAANRSRLTVLVIPPDTDEATADRAMTIAATEDNTRTVADMLSADLPE